MMLLPLIATGVLFYLMARRHGQAWREAALFAAVLMGVSVAVVTETLSPFSLLTRNAICLSWTIIFAAALTMHLTGKRPVNSPSQGGGELSGAGDICPPLSKPWKLLLFGGLGLLVACVGITGLAAPPNTSDAMTYHLPRVVMWISNHSVRFFPTPNYMQLILGPWAEYATLHLQLLWGGDRLDNLPQFFGFVGSMITVSLIAKRLDAPPRGQALAAIVCATIPEGVLEASGAMNTYVSAFWIATTVYYLLTWNLEPNWLNTICVGLSAGLAILTKGTVYVFLPFMVLACWWLGSRASRLLFLQRAAVFLLLIFALNGPQFYRCYALTGQPLGQHFPDIAPALELKVPHPGVKAALSNIIRNLTLHLGTPFLKVNEALSKTIRGAMIAMGMPPDDPNAVWGGLSFHVNQFSQHEIIAGNFPQLVLITVAMGMAFWKCPRGRNEPLFWYAAGILAGFLFFCVALRWQRWNTRYQMPLFVMGAALAGLAIDRHWPEKTRWPLAAALLACGLVLALTNNLRSLVPVGRHANVYQPRAIQYFADQHTNFFTKTIAATQFIDQLHCPEVAIDCYLTPPVLNGDQADDSLFVYPLMALLHADGSTRRVCYSGVNNITAQYAAQNPHPVPCAVICLGGVKIPEKWAQYRNVGGRASIFGDIVVFSAAGDLPNSGQPLKEGR